MNKTPTLQDLQAQVEELKQLCGQIVEKLHIGVDFHANGQTGVISDAYGSTTLDTTPGG
jgi:hypothetical protein